MKARMLTKAMADARGFSHLDFISECALNGQDEV